MSDGVPVPGWYDDPDHADYVRYWDGSQWTSHRYPKPSAAPPRIRPGPVAPPRGLVGNYRSDQAGLALGLSIASLFCCGLLAIPGFLIGRREMEAADAGLIPQSKRGLAVAAQIISAVSLVLLVIVLVLLGSDTPQLRTP